ncbi:NAD(P)H-hydrate dehydratase [Brachybacterium vulturis]|uniref:Bifunctional NAD(P)H-hydrate repair enzyme n=1 Tax=Brachybacterium vulturis TaxID=2017484 RepID=A0A291GMS5_9MICO|nr:NAD(P)H-hydrate dehydratase [Brachybacterium vulturis]ATG51336.1 NAD(P)H-hydrate dehydratase [Brachybacterium vulturis]
MNRAYSAQAVRDAEAPLLAAGEPLMLRAARALAEHVAEHLRSAASEELRGRGGRVLVLAGAGANGGDGLHAAALLRRDGIAADAIATADRLHEEGAAALRAAGGTILPLADTAPGMLEEQLATTTVVLDAMLGLGGRPEVPAALAPLLAVVRSSGVPVIAVDLPSFVDATTGQAAAEALLARETVTFGALKAGLLLPGGAERSGSIHLVDLGLSPHLTAAPTVLRLEDADVRALFPHPDRDASKYTRGVVALAAGSEQFPGAAVLTASGAARTGAGMVRCLAPERVLDLVLRERPEIVTHPIAETVVDPGAVDLAAVGRTDALVVGPGLAADDPRATAGLDGLREGTGTLRRGVIDAGALSALTTAHRFGPDVVLTPHRGEAERLATRLEVDPELPGAQLAPALARATGATVLLKGAITLIAPGDGGPLRAQDDATAQLATAGTGDVLAGVLGTLLAAGLPGPDAAALAAILHGRAGRLASRDGRQPLVALDVAAHLPEAIGTILAGAQP